MNHVLTLLTSTCSDTNSNTSTSTGTNTNTNTNTSISTSTDTNTNTEIAEHIANGKSFQDKMMEAVLSPMFLLAFNCNRLTSQPPSPGLRDRRLFMA